MYENLRTRVLSKLGEISLVNVIDDNSNKESFIFTAKYSGV